MLALPLVGRQDYRGAREGHRCRPLPGHPALLSFKGCFEDLL